VGCEVKEFPRRRVFLVPKRCLGVATKNLNAIVLELYTLLFL
jgi:hypothetical protein